MVLYLEGLGKVVYLFLWRILYFASPLEEEEAEDDDGDRVAITVEMLTLSRYLRYPRHIGVPPIFSSVLCCR